MWFSCCLKEIADNNDAGTRIKINSENDFLCFFFSGDIQLEGGVVAGLHDVDHGLVGDECVVPSGCDFEGDDAQRVGHDDVADVVHFGPKYNIDFDEGSQTLKKCECETCGKKCARKCELKRHILSVHN